MVLDLKYQSTYKILRLENAPFFNILKYFETNRLAYVQALSCLLSTKKTKSRDFLYRVHHYTVRVACSDRHNARRDEIRA